jgi:hypothetical protein
LERKRERISSVASPGISTKPIIISNQQTHIIIHSLLDMLTVYTVWVINKAGGLIFFREFSTSPHRKLSANDTLVIASTLQSVHALTGTMLCNAKASSSSGSNSFLPAPPAGFTRITYRNAYALHCLATPTGLKFMVTCGPRVPIADAQALLRRVYELYVEYALKNYFYTPDMPIRCEQFDFQLNKLCK